MNYELKYPQYAKALYDALKHDPFYKAMEESVTICLGQEGMLRYMDYSIGEGERYGELFIPEHHPYGISIWSKPLSPGQSHKQHHEKENFLRRQMGEKSLETYHAIVGFMTDKSTFLISRRYWYLSIIGILPEYQGQGLGANLVTAILKKTDSAGIPTYLETFTPRNMSFYKRFGYQVVDSFHEPVTGAEYWLMTRGIC